MITLKCLVSNPLSKQMFHQDYIDLRSRIIIFDFIQQCTTTMPAGFSIKILTSFPM